MLLLVSCSNERSSNREMDPPYITIERQDPLHNLSNSKFTKKIVDEKTIRELGASINHLPEFPRGIIHCPADNGVQYEMDFHNSLDDRVVLVHATGCQQVQVNSKTYWAMEPKGNGFRALLIEKLGLSEKEFLGG
ncbi:hypothetical protein [Paenibacillus chibensis]|uniref:hypothetical protein n=2 Tax=Paenibacillus chibensis TaxID=59846 RepID=UPI000FD94D73|nr:hypothetical protein [Paenibacillus chibensis]MEC0373336.1 hypothetical protein [Paenibacillus chibensis]